ncbi:hypothetical protein AB7M17_008108 [Bradyrhizobium sp. USDA 377]
MDEVSDSSNSSAPEMSAFGARLAATGQLRRLSQQDGSRGTDPLDDRILTVSSTDGERGLAIKGDGGTIAFGTATSGAPELPISGDDMSSSPGTDRSLTITDSSASHVGDVLQSDPVAAPMFDDSRASRQASSSTSVVADRSMPANDVLEPPAAGTLHDAGSAAHRNGASSRGAGLNNDAGSAGAFGQSQHVDHRIASAPDVLPLDDILDPSPHHSAAGDHHNVPANDDAKPAHADAVKIADASKASGHVNANHDDTTSHATSGLASDGATIDQAQAAPPSTGELVEAGAKAILLATDESPNRIGPHASAADIAPGAAQGHVHSSAHATTAFSPGVIGARDQLASAIATATPETAAITTLPSAQITGAALPTLGGDVHALQKHAA